MPLLIQSSCVLFDTHCHLDVSVFDADRSSVLQRARQAGVGWIVNPAYDLISSQRAVQLATQVGGIYAAVGIHPNECAEWDATTADALRAMAAHPRVVAIGEIGLDYHWQKTTREQQCLAFEAQIALAREMHLPIIVHCREAYDDCLSILRAHAQDMPCVLHAFGGDVTHLRAALDLGCAIGIGGPITYPKAHLLREVARLAPLESLVVETDAPYLPPQPKRGQRNEPAWVRTVAEHLGHVRNMSLEAVAQATTDNAFRLLRIHTREAKIP